MTPIRLRALLLLAPVLLFASPADARSQTIEVIREIVSPDEIESIRVISPPNARIGVEVSYEQEESDGVRVMGTLAGSPAWSALRTGDLITHLAGRALAERLADAEAEARFDAGAEAGQSRVVQRFVHLAGALEPGRPVELRVRRDGSVRTLEVTPERVDQEREIEIRLRADAIRERGEEIRLRADEVLEREFEIRERAGEIRERADAVRERAIEAAGSLSPLIIVDGVITDRTLGDVETLDIESIEVVKGSAAESLYGARGRNGVVQIRTRRGAGPSGEPLIVRGTRLRGDAMPESGRWEVVTGTRLDDATRVGGVEFVELSPELGSYFDTERGLLVIEVGEDAALPLRPGDVLLAIDGRTPTSITHLRRIVDSYLDNERFSLRVLRQGETLELEATRRQD